MSTEETDEKTGWTKIRAEAQRLTELVGDRDYSGGQELAEMVLAFTAYEPVENDLAGELIGEGVHTGLRKGSEDPKSGPLWRAIADADRAWGDALNFCINGLDSMGYRLCKEAR